jgi:hypothetical protein
MPGLAGGLDIAMFSVHYSPSRLLSVFCGTARVQFADKIERDKFRNALGFINGFINGSEKSCVHARTQDLSDVARSRDEQWRFRWSPHLFANSRAEAAAGIFRATTANPEIGARTDRLASVPSH